MNGWFDFIGAFVAFGLSHALPPQSFIKPHLVRYLGQRGYVLAYSLVSFGILAWLVIAAGRAPYVELWAPAPWQRWVPFLAMPVAFVLVTCAVGVPNPLSFGGRNNANFEPRRPGIAGVVRHPVLWALFLWAAAHLLPNGDLAHVILFGLSALFAFMGQRAVDRRMKRRFSAEEWGRLASKTSLYPFSALLDGRWKPDYRKFPIGRVGTGVLLFLLVLYSHEPAIGYTPFPDEFYRLLVR